MYITILRVLDTFLIGTLVILFSPLKYLSLKKKATLLRTPKKICIIRLWALGSSLLTFSMIATLKKKYPHAQLDLLCTHRNKNVYAHQGYFDHMYNIFTLKDLFRLLISFKKYDIVIDAEDYFRLSTLVSLWIGKINIGYTNIALRAIGYNSGIVYNDHQHAMITFLDLLRPLGISPWNPERMEKFIYRKEHLASVETLLKKYDQYFRLCVHIGGAETSPERFWNINNWKVLIQQILKEQKKTCIFLSGTAFEKKKIELLLAELEEKDTKNIVDLSGAFNLDQFAFFLQEVDCLVSNDTGAMHLGASMGTKTIGLFGPNLPERFGPYPLDTNIALYKGDGTPYINVHEGKFSTDIKKSVDRITPEEVYECIFPKRQK